MASLIGSFGCRTAVHVPARAIALRTEPIALTNGFDGSECAISVPTCAKNGAGLQPAELGEEAAAEIELVCFAELRSGAIALFPFADKAEAIRNYLDQRLQNRRVRAFYFEELPQTGADLQADCMRETAEHAGIAHCPMADYLEFTGKLPREALTFHDCVAACTARHPGADEVDAACQRGCGG